MSVFFYYGGLADATITEGDVTCDAQHPITNLNYLDKGLYAKFDDNDSEASEENHGIELACIDFGEEITASSFVVDIDELSCKFISVWYDLSQFYLKLYGSLDDVTYTEMGSISIDGYGSTSEDNTYTDIYSDTFTEETYRYYKLIAYITIDASSTLTWKISGKINNLYIGDYLEMPSPELVNDELEHDVELMTSYGGKRVAVEKQEQRKIWNYDYLNLTDTEKANQTAFDVVAGRGKIPVYFENVSGTTQKEDLTYCRVTNKASRQETASGNHSTSQIIEEEL